MLFLLTAAHAASCLESGDVERLHVEVDFARSTTVETWTVGWDEGSCTFDTELPDALDGAHLAEPVTLDGHTTVVLDRTRILDGAGSGSLDAWRAEAQSTVVTFQVPPSVPLQVFTDERAHRFAGDRRLEIWWDVGDTSSPELIWTTWSDWVSAGDALEQDVLSRVPSTRDLGMLGRSLRYARIPELLARLDEALELISDDTPGWDPGRPVEEVLASGQATPSERALVLLSMLRGAGFKASPAWYTPDDDPRIPRTLPAPHLLPFPGIGVVEGRDVLYLDPGAVGARPPEVPARMRGGRVLVAGRHLTVPVDTGAPRGELRIAAELQVERSGEIHVTADLSAKGAAEQVLRGRLAGKDASQWSGEVLGWLAARTGQPRDLLVDVRGLEGEAPLTIRITYIEPTKLQGTGRTLRGPLRDLLAPKLASLLPPGVTLEERLHVLPPEGSIALTAVRPVHPPSEGVLVNRTLHATDGELLLGSDWRVVGARASEAELNRIPQESELLIFPEDAGARRALKHLDLPYADVAVLDAMLLWHLGQPEKARKRLDKLHPRKLTVLELADLVARYVPPGDSRAWQALVQLLDNDHDRLVVIDHLVDTGARRLAWQLATFMAKKSPDPLTRARSLVQVARFQGPEQPDGQADPEGHRAWRDPVKLLEKARSLAGEHEEIVRLELARAYLRQGTPMEAQELLDRAMETPTPLTRAVRAEFGAMTGAYGIDVLGLAREAVQQAPNDPDVRESVGRALAFLGRRRQGVADILLSAELAGNDATRWLTAAGFAADFGDLRAAVFAARRASDLQPDGLVQGVRLQLLAKLARDEEALELAIQRSRGTDLYADSGDDLDSLIALAEDQVPQDPLDAEAGLAHPWKLALLRHHDGDVAASRTRLLERAELHYERGMMEDAALDGSLLLDRYRASEGARFVLAGVTSRFRHADPGSLIKRHLRSSSVRDADTDLEIVLGGRPSATGSGERRKTLSLMRSNPERVAQQATTWPVAMRDFELEGPPGFTRNRYLSSITGVKAWSDAERQMTVLVTERSTGNLPPPFANLYRTGPTVLSTQRGATVVRLDGGALPLFAGVTLMDGRDVWGIALDPSAARDAVLYGIQSLTVPEP